MFLRRLRVQRADWLKRGLSARELEQWRLAGREALEQHRADCPVVSAGTQSAFWYRRNLVECFRLQGLPWGQELGQYYLRQELQQPGSGRDRGDGSCMIIVATDAPLDARNLKRLAASSIA